MRGAQLAAKHGESHGSDAWSLCMDLFTNTSISAKRFIEIADNALKHCESGCIAAACSGGQMYAGKSGAADEINTETARIIARITM